MKLPALCIVEVNVGIAANGRNTHASLVCQLACIEFLQALVEKGRLALDAGGLIFDEYKGYFNFNGAPGTGDQFFRWVNDIQWKSESCHRQPITLSAERGFEEFPTSAELKSFDFADRKYAAVAKGIGKNCAIFNATDSDWKHHGAAFRKNGVTVVNLCPEDLKDA